MIVDLYKKYKYRPVVLLILDGWGLSPSWGGNAISLNNPATINELWRDYPKTILKAFELVAGKHGKVGNSEIGHASIGCGRIVQQDINEIDQAIDQGSFFSNPNLLDIAEYVKSHHSTFHLIGLLSDGAIHAHIDHLFALLEFIRQQKIAHTALHLITDGRDSDKMSALNFITRLEKKLDDLGFNKPNASPEVKIASVIGRFYAMDRDGNLDRTSRAYQLQVYGRGNQASSARQAITQSYQQGIESDEFIPPFSIIQKDGKNVNIKDGDAVLFFNFRSDRARQMTRFYVDENYLKKWVFWRQYPLLDIYFATLASYHLAADLAVRVIFPPALVKNSLAEILANHGLKQLRVAESEKYAHITYFFNGGQEEIFPGEKRIIIPSQKINSFKDAPAMSAEKITQEIINGLQSNKYDFMVANFANVDMVGHSGDITAVSQAVQVVDEQIKKIMAVGLKKNAAIIITADHGNAEQMVAVKSQDPETRHTLSPVPFMLISKNNKKDLLNSALTPSKGYLGKILATQHTLADIAPTILELLAIAKPREMTGKSLLNELE